MSREQSVATGLGLFSVIYMIAAWRLPRFSLGTAVIDSHVFPLILGVVLLLLSIIYYVQSPRPAGKEKPLLEGVNKPLLIKLVAATFVYALVLSTLGYLIATSLYLITAMFLLGRRKWVSLLVTGIGFSSVTYFAFAHLLQVPLAQGILPF